MAGNDAPEGVKKASLSEDGLVDLATVFVGRTTGAPFRDAPVLKLAGMNACSSESGSPFFWLTLQDAMPRPGLLLVHFNDACCGSPAELRSIILKARRLAHDHAEQERVAAAVKTWLLARIEKKRAALPTAIGPDEPFTPRRLAA